VIGDGSVHWTGFTSNVDAHPIGTLLSAAALYVEGLESVPGATARWALLELAARGVVAIIVVEPAVATFIPGDSVAGGVGSVWGDCVWGSVSGTGDVFAPRES
jgi:hypothetical protein